MKTSLQSTVKVGKRNPILLTILVVTVFDGLYSEGYDRLWIAHFLESFTFPTWGGWEPFVWLGVLQAIISLTGIVATQIGKRIVDEGRVASLVSGLKWGMIVVLVALFGFGWTVSLEVAVVIVVLIGAVRSVLEPWMDAWINHVVDDPQVRATVFSAQSQAGAIGEMSGGPISGGFGQGFGLRWAFTVSAMLGMPAVFALWRLGRKGMGEKQKSMKN